MSQFAARLLMTIVGLAVGAVCLVLAFRGVADTEQSTGIGQVNQSVAQLDQSTQQNAALVEQSAAAAESLRQQAERLAGAVASFRLLPSA